MLVIAAAVSKGTLGSSRKQLSVWKTYSFAMADFSMPAGSTPSTRAGGSTV